MNTWLVAIINRNIRRNNIRAVTIYIICFRWILGCRDELGYTPLITAVRSGSVSMVRLLLQFGAKYEQTDSNGVSVLEHAKEKQNSRMLKYLRIE